MANQFWVWKKKNCSNKDIEWVSMTGDEFYVFIRDPKNKDRHIIRLTDGGDSELDTIYIETNKREYKKWEKEKDRNKYLKKYESNIEIVSAFTYEDDDDCNYYDRIQNEEVSLEEVVENIMMVGMLHDAIKTLKKREQEIIYLHFFLEKSQREIAEYYGISQQAVNEQVQKIINFLNFFLVKTKKSSQ